MGGKSSPPPAPDYRAAAQETAAGNREANTAQTWANRPEINTPFGRQTWRAVVDTDPATGQQVTRWIQNNELTPDSQAALEGQQRLQNARTQTAEGLLGRAQDAFRQPFDTSGFTRLMTPDRQRLDTQGPQMNTGGFIADDNSDQIQTQGPTAGGYSDAQTSAIMQRMAPVQQRQRAALETQLVNQGVTRGSEAWRNAMDDLGRQENDAALGAINQGFQQGNAVFGQELASRGFGNQALGQQFGQRTQTAGAANAIRQGDNATNMSQWQARNATRSQQQSLDQQLAQLLAGLRGQEFQEASTLRNMPLNEMNAFLTGQQVQAPQFQGPNSTANRAEGPNYLQAAGMQGQYDMNANMMANQSRNSFMNGLFGLGGAAIGAPTGTFRGLFG